MFCAVNNEENFAQIVENIKSFEVFEQGVSKVLNQKDEDFKCIFNKLKIVFESARVMPAFGVSLHKETMEELKNGYWLKINFNSNQNVNGLIFDSLLIKLETTYGVNLIRGLNGVFEGRCIYLDFDSITNLMEVIDLN